MYILHPVDVVFFTPLVTFSFKFLLLLVPRGHVRLPAALFVVRNVVVVLVVALLLTRFLVLLLLAGNGSGVQLPSALRTAPARRTLVVALILTRREGRQRATAVVSLHFLIIPVGNEVQAGADDAANSFAAYDHVLLLQVLDDVFRPGGAPK